MRLKAKLTKWQKEGLIEDRHREAILSFERAKLARHFALGMQLCGGFAILLGFALIIAANWHELGRHAKLIGHFILNAVIGLWLFKTGYDQRKPVLQEMLTLAAFGLNMTFIALIGQVFQLDGSMADALLVWMIISAPMMMVYARSGFTAWIWTVALYVTAFMVFGQYSDALEAYPQFVLGYFLSIFIPLALYADHCVTATRVFRPSFAECFRRTSLLVMVVSASLASVGFYGLGDDIIKKADHLSLHYVYMGCVTALALGYLVFMKRYFAKVYDGGYDWAILKLCVIFTAIPLLANFESSVLGALHFVVLWGAIGYVAQRHSAEHIVNLAIALVTIRMYVIFIELFGDALMETGLGLIIGGGVMIVFVKAAQKVKRRINPSKMQQEAAA